MHILASSLGSKQSLATHKHLCEMKLKTQCELQLSCHASMTFAPIRYDIPEHGVANMMKQFFADMLERPGFGRGRLLSAEAPNTTAVPVVGPCVLTKPLCSHCLSASLSVHQRSPPNVLCRWNLAVHLVQSLTSQQGLIGSF